MKDPDKVMTVVEHLDELRWRLVSSLLVVAGSCFIMLFFAKDIIRLLEAPAGNTAFQALSLEEPLLVYLKVTFYSGLILSCPYVLWQVCRFIAPGLKDKERQLMAPIVVGGPLLFLAGCAFAYFCVLPPMLHFFSVFSQGLAPLHQRLDFYISLVSTILLYMGLCFQLPIIIFALSFTGLVNSKQLISVWKWALVGSSLVAAIITPDPTAISMLIVMAALIALYFVSIGLLCLFGR